MNEYSSNYEPIGMDIDLSNPPIGHNFLSIDELWQEHSKIALSPFKDLLADKADDLADLGIKLKSEKKKKKKMASSIGRAKGQASEEVRFNISSFTSSVWAKNKELFGDLFGPSVGMTSAELMLAMKGCHWKQVNTATHNFLTSANEKPKDCHCRYCIEMQNFQQELKNVAVTTASILRTNFSSNIDALAILAPSVPHESTSMDVENEQLDEYEGHNVQFNAEYDEPVHEEVVPFIQFNADNGNDEYEGHNVQFNADIDEPVNAEMDLIDQFNADNGDLSDNEPVEFDQLNNVDDLMREHGFQEVNEEQNDEGVGQFNADDVVIDNVNGRLFLNESRGVAAIIYHNSLSCEATMAAIDGSLTRDTNHINPILVCIYTEDGGKYYFTVTMRPYAPADYNQHSAWMVTSIERLRDELTGLQIITLGCVSDYMESYVTLVQTLPAIPRVSAICHLIDRFVFLLSPNETNRREFTFIDDDGIEILVRPYRLKNLCMADNEIYDDGTLSKNFAKRIWKYLNAQRSENCNFGFLKKYPQGVLQNYFAHFAGNERGARGTALNLNWQRLCIVAELLVTLLNLQNVINAPINAFNQSLNVINRQVIQDAANFIENITVPSALFADNKLSRDLVSSLRFVIEIHDNHPNLDIRLLDGSIDLHYGIAERLKTNNARNLPNAMGIIDALGTNLSVTGNSFFSNREYLIRPQPLFLDILYIDDDDDALEPDGNQVFDELRNRFPADVFAGMDDEVINSALEIYNHTLQNGGTQFYFHPIQAVDLLVRELARRTLSEEE